MSNEIVILSRASTVWPGARELIMRENGRMLTISRVPIRDAAMRLVQEGYATTDHIVIVDETSGQTVVRAIRDGLDEPPLPPDRLSAYEKELSLREAEVAKLDAELKGKLAAIRAITA